MVATGRAWWVGESFPLFQICICQEEAKSSQEEGAVELLKQAEELWEVRYQLDQFRSKS